MSIKSQLRNLFYLLFKKKNFNYLIVSLIVFIFVFLVIGNYNLSFKEGMELSAQVLSPDKTLDENFQEVMKVNSESKDSSDDKKNLSNYYANNAVTLHNSLIEQFTENMSDNKCSSNYSDASTLGSNELFNNVCNSVKTLNETNESLLSGPTPIV